MGPTVNHSLRIMAHDISGTAPSRVHGSSMHFLAVLEVNESARWPVNDVRGTWPIHTTDANT